MNRRIFFALLAVIALAGLAEAQSRFGIDWGIDSSDITAQKIVDAEQPVLADFWAAWCAPCRLLAPIVAELKKEYKGRIKVIKVNVDNNRRLATYFHVQGIPAVFIIADKTVVKFLPGLQSKSVYKAAIEEVLGKSDSTSQ